MAGEAPGRGTANLLATLLAASTAVLAIVVALLEWTIITGPPIVEVDVDARAIAKAVSAQLEADGFLKKIAFDERMGSLDAAVLKLLTAEEFQRSLESLKGALGDACCGASPAVRQPRIWVVFDNARLEGGPPDTESSLVRLTEDSHGIAIRDGQRDRLNKLAAALRACATPERRVRLKVQGFSSTREFVDEDGMPMPDSAALNVKTANLRAKVVIDHLRERDVDADNGVDVVHVRWQQYDDMHRPFLDSAEEIESTDQELLNRAVLVEVQDAGACAAQAAGGGNVR